MRKADELIDKMFKNLNMKKNGIFYGFFTNWEEICGHELASHSRIVEVEQDKLIIETDHPGWKQMIMLKAHDIIKAVKQKYPELEISSIKVIVRSDVKYE